MQAVVVPDRHAVATPPAAERPARQRLAGIPLALAEVQQAPGRKLLLQPPDQHAGALALLWPERRGVPFGAVHVVDRHERRLATHRQPDVAARELAIDAVRRAHRSPPLLVGVRLGDARRLVNPPHVHLVRRTSASHSSTLAGNRRGAERVRRRRQRDVALAGEQPRRRIEPDPSGAGQVHLGPRMQVGEVGRGAARTVERFDVGRRAESDSPRRTARPGRGDAASAPAASRVSRHEPLRERQRLLRRLHARLEPDDVAQSPSTAAG